MKKETKRTVQIAVVTMAFVTGMAVGSVASAALVSGIADVIFFGAASLVLAYGVHRAVENEKQRKKE
jgi:membrane protein implicated in regulation of membrane protease activity